MELRLASEALLRSTPMTPFLTSSRSATHTTRCIRPFRLAVQSQNPHALTSHRCISSTARRPAQAPARKDDEGEKDRGEPAPVSGIDAAEREAAQTATSKPPPSRRKDTLFDFLRSAPRANKSSPLQQNPSSSGPASAARPFNPTAPIPGMPNELLRRPDARRSIDELMKDFGANAGRGPPAPSSSSAPYLDGDRQVTNLASMQRPPSFSLEQINKTIAAEYRQKIEDAMGGPSFRIAPTLGRTTAVNVAANMDVARAFAMVNVKCAINNVRRDVSMQRFHERPGTKRKRLLTLRWRRRFKEAFVATIKRVTEMKKKGW